MRRRGVVDKQAGLTNKHNFCRIIKSRVRMSVVCGIIATERSLSECSFLL